MKKIIFILITFYSVCYGQQSHQNFKINNIALFEGQIYNRMAYTKSETRASNNFDIKYYRCEWETDPAVRYIKGKVTSYFVFTSAADFISFDLMDALYVDSVKANNHLLSYTQQDNSLKINFKTVKNIGALDSVSVYYQGIPPNAGFGSFVNNLHVGIPVMWTLSEPYGSRDWWPCKNGLDDKADSIDVFITAPAEYTAVSNGLRQSVTISGASKITHWKHRYPIASYLVCMAVTNYVEFENHVLIDNVNLLMQTFCYPESLDLFQSKTPLVLESLKYFSKIFGPYPFIKEKYGHVQFGWGGGEEHQTSTFIVTPDENLMAHELAHQWFGDKVTCASWQHIWLNEGFATHLASMDMENKYPLTVTSTRKNEINSITSLPGGSVFVDDTTNVNRIFDSRLTYTKGSHLLYMLRWILGDSIFFKGVNHYFHDPLIGYGFATTKDLQRNLEEASGKKLDYFFNDWFYGQGYPSYHIQWSQLGSDYVKIKMDQTTSHPSVKFFALPVALLFKNATQQKTIVIDNKSNGEIFFKNIGFVADTVIIDSEYWLISANNTAEKVKENIGEKNVVRVFPNPFSNSFYLYLQNFDAQNIQLKIYDAKGRMMLNENLLMNTSLFKEINTQYFSSGVYFVKIETDKGEKATKRILRK
ncbi:MAG TPA: M1 family aminopeptidase [Hanamia sp.]|nr:M1 family aminopeptidase [Hanamia sp.]